jgi:diguanylate cyclase (GGDEF)-like protein
MDLLLIGVAMGLLTTPGARTTSFRLLGASLMALVIADHAYAVQNLDGTYVAGGPIDTLYLISYLTFGAAVLHPSMRRLTEPHPVAVTWLGPVRMIGLAIAMITGPLLVTLGPDSAQGLTVVAVATAILSLLVLARLAGLVGLLERDVDQRRKLEAQLSFQAFHDPLTGLVNRRRFVEQAEAALAARGAPGSVAAMFLDLDDFKTVNDTLGHAAGDELLVVVAERLKSALRGSDVAARLGGDEFGVLLFDVDDVAYAKLISERLLKSVQEPLTIMGRQVEVGASIGIAIDTAAMRTVDDLLGDADVAMYQAKALGKGRSQVFAGAADRSDIPERAWSQPRQNVRRPAVGPAQLEPGAG